MGKVTGRTERPGPTVSVCCGGQLAAAIEPHGIFAAFFRPDLHKSRERKLRYFSEPEEGRRIRRKRRTDWGRSRFSPGRNDSGTRAARARLISSSALPSAVSTPSVRQRISS